MKKELNTYNLTFYQSDKTMRRYINGKECNRDKFLKTYKQIITKGNYTLKYSSTETTYNYPGYTKRTIKIYETTNDIKEVN